MSSPSSSWGDDFIGDGVFVSGFVGGAGDDERGAGLVDEDGIDFVDDAIEVAALDALGEIKLHVVAEVVETEFIVGPVGNVGGVGRAALFVGKVMHDDADGEAEEAVDLAHPLGVALGEVVVDGDDVDALTGERIQVAGQRSDEGFTFTGLHFGDFSAVEDGAADHLDVEVAHADDAHAGFADDGKGFGQQIVERGFFGGLDLIGVGEAFEGLGDALFELEGFSGELLVGEGLEGVFMRGNGGEGGEEALDGAFVGGAEDLGENVVDHDEFLNKRACEGTWMSRNQERCGAVRPGSGAGENLGWSLRLIGAFDEAEAGAVGLAIAVAAEAGT